MNTPTRLERVNQLLIPENMALFLRIMISIPVFRFFTDRVEMPRLLGWLDSRSTEKRPFREKDYDRAELAFRYANFLLVKCLRVKTPCLLRSLILFHIFRSGGLDARIHFGVKKDISQLAGHSWLSIDGKSCFERIDPLSNYLDVYSYPHEPS